MLSETQLDLRKQRVSRLTVEHGENVGGPYSREIEFIKRQGAE